MHIDELCPLAVPAIGERQLSLPIHFRAVCAWNSGSTSGGRNDGVLTVTV